MRRLVLLTRIAAEFQPAMTENSWAHNSKIPKSKILAVDTPKFRLTKKTDDDRTFLRAHNSKSPKVQNIFPKYFSACGHGVSRISRNATFFALRLHDHVWNGHIWDP
jgi:hypothetical protein